MKITLLPIISLLFFSRCHSQQQDPPVEEKQTTVISTVNELPPFIPFTRDAIKSSLLQKTKQQLPLVVHVFVPLCDNVNQGIVPVNATLGDGKNLKTNLYWGARYGVKSFFKYDPSWKLISSALHVSDTILERVVFKKTIEGNTVFIVADAYSGEFMKACLDDYFSALAQQHSGSAQINDSASLAIYKDADLLIFSGHNGLMDTPLDIYLNATSIQKDAAVIGCISYSYFYERLNAVGAYPLITTKSLMAPEAYSVAALIEAWAGFKTEQEILGKVCAAYADYQKISVGAAKTVFTTGW